MTTPDGNTAAQDFAIAPRRRPFRNPLAPPQAAAHHTLMIEVAYRPPVAARGTPPGPSHATPAVIEVASWPPGRPRDDFDHTADDQTANPETQAPSPTPTPIGDGSCFRDRQELLVTGSNHSTLSITETRGHFDNR
jgi:hypothetical protein